MSKKKCSECDKDVFSRGLCQKHYDYKRNRGLLEISKTEKHGLTGTPIHKVWSGIKTRCFVKSSSGYKKYGAKGITMCDEWKQSLIAFYKYMGDPPEGMTIDRIDPYGNYEPGNVRWANKKVQGRNKTTPITNKSGVKGVYFRKSFNKWVACIGVNTKRVHIGYFKLFEDAVKARKEAEIKYWGLDLNK